ncbi:MAG: hypothetical protein IKO42_01050 [Opitutales bacterium]|nr:hypothetical protein [Opitutales bacterium]
MKKILFIIAALFCGFANAYYLPFAEPYIVDEQTGILLYACGAVGSEGCPAIHRNDARFADWASGWKDLVYGANCEEEWRNPHNAIGKASDSVYDILCLGDGGSVVMTFDFAIRDGEGFDFAVFENSFDGYFLELAFVEVSTDGEHFVRFPNLYLDDKSIGAFAKGNPRYVYNLAAKYFCEYGHPFDLAELKAAYEFARSPACTFSEEYKNSILENYKYLDFSNIKFVRIVDIIGDGKTLDCEGQGIYDPVGCVGSAGFDLNAIGVINSQKNSGLKEQTVFFEAIADMQLADISPIALSAFASSGLEVVFEIAQGSGSIENGFYIPAEGVCETVILKASQRGNSVYAPAAAYAKFIISNKKSQQITFPKIADLPSPVASPKLITLKASASSGLKVSYNLSRGDGNFLSSGALRLTDTSAPQIIEVIANQSGNAQYLEAKAVLQNFAIYNAISFSSENPHSDANQNGYSDIFEYAFNLDFSAQNPTELYPQIRLIGKRARVSWRVCASCDQVEISPRYKKNGGGEIAPEPEFDYVYIEGGNVYREFHYDVELAYGDEISAYFAAALKSGEASQSEPIFATLKFSYADWAQANALSGDDAQEGASPFSDGIVNLQKYALGLDGSKSASFAQLKNFGAFSEGGAAVFKFAIASYAADYVEATALWSADLKTWSSENLEVETSDEGDFKIYKVRHNDSSISPIFFKMQIKKR